MKKAVILKIRTYLVDNKGKEKLILEKIKYRCSNCESGWIYKIKKKNQIYCRKCGKLSIIKIKNEN